MLMQKYLLRAAVLCLALAEQTLASVGDRTWIFQKCLQNCVKKECSVTAEDYAAGQVFYQRWLQWSCNDDCSYMCMWKTVEAFNMDNTKVPQFFGKWPFVRMFGIQEPASMFFSLLNGLSHLIMLVSFRRRVPSTAPMYYIWHVYAAIAINAWLWAVIFHTRDFQFTEIMDYVAAVALVIYSMFALCIRSLGPTRRAEKIVCAAFFLSFFLYHTAYLAFIKFDYGYNMRVNIGVGLLNVAGWVIWSWVRRREQPYVWKAALSVLAVSALVLLELLDFPPILWVLDAHALWHAGTAPIPLLWYSFLVDDCHYALKQATGKTKSI